MRIDAAVSLPRGSDSADALSPILRRNKFEGALVRTFSDEETDAVLALAVQNTWIRGIVAPASGTIQHPGLVAVWSESANDTLGLPLDLYMSATTAREVIELARKGRAIAIVPSLDSDIDRWAATMTTIATETSNVSVKVSEMVITIDAAVLRPYIQHLLSVFGPGRIIYSSGWPGGLPDWGWKQSLAVFTQAMGAQSMDRREMILGGTAARHYGFPVE